MIKTKKQMFLIIGVFVVLLVLTTVTYAFFNYTRTGTANTIRVGRIAFSTNQTDTVNLSNVFPISRTQAASDTSNTDDVVITIQGDTDYTGGVEYLVTAVDVANTVGGKSVPISVIVTPSGSLGTASDSYYTARSSATSHIYKVEAVNTLENNGRILVGYIAPNSTPGTASGINGTLTIRAFLDSSLIAISDTYNGEETDNMGTTTEWVNGRTVLTTTEWNSLQSSGVSFKVKIEANEGLWVKQLNNMNLSANSGSVAPSRSTTATVTSAGDGEITCQSSDTSIATCSVSNNILTINGVAKGSASITVTQASTINYEGSSDTYTVTVETGADVIMRLGASQMENVAGAYRYVGSNPDNYVWFNNEQWRIIGVYGDNLKIIKAMPPLSSPRAINSDSSKGNAWNGSDLEIYLNGDYYNGLTETSQNMIVEGVWNAGETTMNANASEAYNAAILTQVTGKKVGLIATYEYLYAAENDGACWNTSGFSYSSCTPKNWLKSYMTMGVWTINPDSTNSNYGLYQNGGNIYNGYVYYNYYLFPIVYLDSSVTITGGNGQTGETNSYKLGYTES